MIRLAKDTVWGQDKFPTMKNGGILEVIVRLVGAWHNTCPFPEMENGRENCVGVLRKYSQKSETEKEVRNAIQ